MRRYITMGIKDQMGLQWQVKFRETGDPEVDEAISSLREQTNDQAEILMGVIANEQMVDRAQVILIVTGLGAPTLEDTLSSLKAPQPEVKKVVEEPVLEPITVRKALEPALPAQAIDLPAFMRRRNQQISMI